MNQGCSCEKCVAACWHTPGWFGSIEEIEGAARLMGMPVKDFVKEFLIQEYWAGEEEDIIVPSPRRNFDRYKGPKETDYSEIFKEENGKGFVLASWGHNLIRGYACIFLDENNRCLIHQSKPRECRECFVCKGQFIDRSDLLPYWKEHQDWIRKMER